MKKMITVNLEMSLFEVLLWFILCYSAFLHAGSTILTLARGNDLCEMIIGKFLRVFRTKENCCGFDARPRSQ